MVGAQDRNGGAFPARLCKSGPGSTRLPRVSSRRRLAPNRSQERGESRLVNTGLWIVLGTLIWFLLAALVGPAERRRLDAEPDPY